MIESAETHGLDRVRRSCVSRDDRDRRRPDRRLAHVLQDVEAVDIRQSQVEQDRVGIARGRERERVLAVGGRDGVMAEVAQRLRQTVAQRRLVVDHQNEAHGFVPAGRSSVKVVPSSR